MSSSNSAGAPQSVSVEQLVSECFVKTAQIVLSSRVHEPVLLHASPPKKSSPWFKLEISDEIESAKPILQRWRSERGIGLPLIIEIHLQPHSADPTSPTKTLLERWIVHYSPMVSALPHFSPGLSRSQMARLSPLGVYKRLSLLVRSLYTYCRILPAYKLYRAVTQNPAAAPFALVYTLHSTLPSSSVAATQKLKTFEFSPVNTSDGHFRVCVDYQPASSVRVMVPLCGIQSPRRLQPSSRPTSSASKASSDAPMTNITAQQGSAGSSPAGGGGGLLTPRRRSWSSTFRNSSSPRSYDPPAYHISGMPSPGSSPHSLPNQMYYTGSSLPKSMSTPVRPASSVGRPPLPPPTREKTSPRGVEHPHQAGRSASGSVSPAWTAAIQGNGPNVLPVMEQEASTEVEESDDQGEDDQEEVQSTVNLADSINTTTTTTTQQQQHNFRTVSAPVQIPKASLTQRRHHRPRGLKSSGDLRALQLNGGQYNTSDHHLEGMKPSSAPTVSLLKQHQTESETQTSTTTHPRPSTLQTTNVQDSMASSSTPVASCSPDLPFAFTPTARQLGASSSFSSITHLRPSQSISYEEGTYSNPPSPGTVSGREIPSGMALMRRSSFGGASIGRSYSEKGEFLLMPNVGYSVSPFRHMESSAFLQELGRGGGGSLSPRPTSVSVHSSATTPKDNVKMIAFSNDEEYEQQYKREELGASVGGQADASATADLAPMMFDLVGGSSADSDYEGGGIEFLGKGRSGRSSEDSSKATSSGIDSCPATDSDVQNKAYEALSNATAVGAFIRVLKDSAVRPPTGLLPLEGPSVMKQIEAICTRYKTEQQSSPSS